MADKEDVLKEIYYDPAHPASLGGAQRLFEAARKRLPDLKKDKVVEWLRGQDAYTLHRSSRQRFARRKVTVGHEGQQLQADLLDVRNHSRDNDGINYLLTAVDTFSRKGWAIPVRNKTGERVAVALDAILKDNSYFSLQTDKGKEFYNDPVNRLLKSHGVKLFSTESDNIKASMVERFNKTLRGRIHRSITARQNKRFLHILPDMVGAYNAARHGAIGMAPDDVGPSNRETVHQRLYVKKRPATGEQSLKVGDAVRMASHRGVFKRGYTPNWTRELFVISDVNDDSRPITYELKDLNDEPISGTFYHEELQLVVKPDEYLVEEVLKTRRDKRGKKQYFVRWLGYPDSFNSWVDEDDFAV